MEMKRTKKKMTREEAGRKGGKAPHVCRGRECQAKKQGQRK